MPDKESIRADMKKKRAALSDGEVNARSRAILHRFLKTEIYQKAEWLFAYMSFKNEADTRALIECALGDGKRVALPKVRKKLVMDFYEIKALSEITPGAMGILEPISDAAVIPKRTADCSEILMLVPGLAFDLLGRRIGWGGGFYDMYLSKYKDIVTVGLAYDFQIYDRFKTQAHDIPVSYVVTDTKIIDTKRRNCDG